MGRRFRRPIFHWPLRFRLPDKTKAASTGKTKAPLAGSGTDDADCAGLARRGGLWLKMTKSCAVGLYKRVASKSLPELSWLIALNQLLAKAICVVLPPLVRLNRPLLTLSVGLVSLTISQTDN